MQLKHTLAAMAFGFTAVGALAQTVVGVSWSNFQEERWKTDEAAIKAQLEKLGAKYISADAGGSPEKQLGDIEGLMSKGAKALIVLAMDKDAILPAITKATRQKVPVVAYDRLIEAPGVFYITFDNVEVGRMEAREVFKVKPKGNYVIIKGSPSDPNADFLRAGQQEVLDAAIKKGDIKIVGDEYTDGWKPEVARILPDGGGLRAQRNAVERREVG
ncbi:substrate-binding domain-containing protein, partial [Variovorax sp. Varisp62]|uniref:substrate-binding domain-containing protein n=1 Tax=Variovorax sp. Varisp62 TaxID=3243049 RepID=UPI0039B69AFC